MIRAGAFVCALVICLIPYGANCLKCHYCSSIGGTESISCEKPQTKSCGENEDQCNKIQLLVNETGFGQNEQIAVNCTSSADCNEEVFCKNFKQTLGDGRDSIQKCSVRCCKDNLCNHPNKSAKVEEATKTGIPANGSTGKPRETGTSSFTTNAQDSNQPGSTVAARPVGSVPSHLIQNTKCFTSVLALIGLTIWLV